MRQNDCDTKTLDLDLGNTRLKYRCGHQRGWIYYDGSLPNFDDANSLQRIRIASVLGCERNKEWAATLRQRFGLEGEFAKSRAQCAGVTNGYHQPAAIGVDRWLAVVAGYNKVGPAMVVDVGTATTIDFVDAQGAHLGGFIVPGRQLLQSCLLQGTEAVRIDTESKLTSTAIGRDTESALANGALLLLVRLIEAELVRARQLCQHSVTLLMCGGGARGVAAHLSCPFDIVPDLVLDGLDYALP